MPAPKFDIPEALIALIREQTAQLTTRQEKVRLAATMLQSETIYPSANKVYECIKTGSMASISADLKHFQEQNKTRGNVAINSPLPPLLLSKFSDALSATWEIACKDAHDAFAVEREAYNEAQASLNRELEEVKRLLAVANATIQVKNYAIEERDQDLRERELQLMAEKTRAQDLQQKAHEYQEMAQAAEASRAQAQLQFSEELGLMREQARSEIARFEADIKHFKLEAYNARLAEKEANDKMTRESVKAQEALKALREQHQKVESDLVVHIDALQAQVKALEESQAKEVEENIRGSRRRVFVAKAGKAVFRKSLR